MPDIFSLLFLSIPSVIFAVGAYLVFAPKDKLIKHIKMFQPKILSDSGKTSHTIGYSDDQLANQVGFYKILGVVIMVVAGLFILTFYTQTRKMNAQFDEFDARFNAQQNLLQDPN